MKINFNMPQFFGNIFKKGKNSSVQGINPNFTQPKTPKEKGNNISKTDRITISPQGRAASLIENLNKQKMKITEKKNKFMADAIKEGKPMDMIKSQMEAFDEQIKNLDKEISAINAQQLKENAEKTQNTHKKENKNSNLNKTKEEMEKAEIGKLTELTTEFGATKNLDSVKKKVEGDIGVMESEIALDKSRIKGDDSTQVIRQKENKLTEMENHLTQLTYEIGEKISDINDKTEKPNEIQNNSQESKTDDKQKEIADNADNKEQPQQYLMFNNGLKQRHLSVLA